LYGIAVDPQSNLYVTAFGGPDPGGLVSEIIIYPPNANGTAVPTRTIVLPTPSGSIVHATDVNVDASGSIYAATVQSATPPSGPIDVFAPNAAGTPSPAQIIMPPDGGTEAVTFDDGGDLYAGGVSGNISVYSNPATSPALSRTVCEQRETISLGHGLIAGNQWFYAAELTRRGYERLAAWKGAGARPCPRVWSPAIAIAGLSLKDVAYGALAVDATAGRLFVSETTTNDVYELNALDFRPQQPIATLHAPFKHPLGVAIGP
jgi:hypothetical protein